MERGDGGWPKNSSPGSARATMSTARSLPSATRSSRSIPSRAPRRNPSPRPATTSREQSARRQGRLRAGAADAVVPLDRRRAARGRPASSPATAARRGITHDPDPVEHDAIRFDAPGYVEVWPSIGADAVEEPDDWTQAVDHATGAGGARRRDGRRDDQALAGYAARSSKARGKRLTPGDVMVLVRKRDRFVHALSRSLKEKRHPGRRRRPAEPARPYRGQGPDRARPLPAPAGGRPVAGRRAAQPDLRRSTRTRCSSSPHGAAERHLAGRVAARPGAGRSGPGRRSPRSSTLGERSGVQAGVRVLCRRARPRRRAQAG